MRDTILRVGLVGRCVLAKLSKSFYKGSRVRCTSESGGGEPGNRN